MSVEDGDGMSRTTITATATTTDPGHVPPAPPSLVPEEPGVPPQAGFVGGLALALLLIALAFAIVVPLAGRLYG